MFYSVFWIYLKNKKKVILYSKFSKFTRIASFVSQNVIRQKKQIKKKYENREILHLAVVK